MAEGLRSHEAPPIGKCRQRGCRNRQRPRHQVPSALRFLDRSAGIRDVLQAAASVLLKTLPQKFADFCGSFRRQSLPIRLAF